MFIPTGKSDTNNQVKKQCDNRKLVHSDKPAKRNSRQGKSTDAEQCNETPKLRPRRSRQLVDPDGEIETFRGNGTNETEDYATSSLALDLSHEKVCESDLEDENDVTTHSENLRNFNENVSSLSNQVTRDNTNENTVTCCEEETLENKGCDCTDVICDFGPIELPRTGHDSANSTNEKRLSIASVDANCEASNIENSPSVTVAQSSSQSKLRRFEVNGGIVDDGITTIDNIVITRKQSEDIRQWIQGEKNESDSNSEDGEISFKSSPVKQTETPVKTSYFHCDCGHYFARKSSLTVHTRSSKCPLNGGKLKGTASGEAVSGGKVSFEVDSAQTGSPAEELEDWKRKIMPRPRRASLPVTGHGGGAQNGLPLKEMVPPQNKTLRGRRSVGASKHEKGETQDTESHSVAPEDGQMSIADMLDSLMSTDENTRKSKKRTRSVSDVENESDTASKKSRMNVTVVSEPSEDKVTEDGSKKGNKRERRKSQRTNQKNLESNDEPSGTNVDTDANVSKGDTQMEDKHDASTLNTVSSPSANAGKVVKRRGRPPSKKIPSDDMSEIDQTDGSSDLPENPVVNKRASASNDERPVTGEEIQSSEAGPAPKRKRGRPPKSVTITANTQATDESATKKESTDDSFDISPKTTSKSNKVFKVPKRRRTEQFVKKSLARAKANLSNRDNKPEGQITRVVKCSCGGLYSQVGSVRRHQLNTKCPLGKYQYVYVEKVEKPVKERKYVCSCGKAFTQNSSMQRHQKNSTCPLISAGVLNPNSAGNPGRRRKSSLAVSSSVDGARDNLEGQSTDTSEVSQPAGPQKSSPTSGAPKTISKTDATAASATEDSRAELDEEPELGKRVDYSLGTSYICSCNQTFKFYGSIRRHQKHTKCSSMRKFVKGQDAESRYTQGKEQKDTRNPSDQETTERDRNLNEDSKEETLIKKEPGSSEDFEDVPSPFTKKRRISTGTKKRQSTSSTKEKGGSSSSEKNKSIDQKTSDSDISNYSLFCGGGDERRKRKRKKRLKESGELVAYFPCPCGKKYKHKRDLYTHQKRSATCPIIARLTKPVLFKICTFKSGRGQSKTDDSDSSSSEEENSDDKTSESSEESSVGNESEEELEVMSQTVEVKKPNTTSPKKNTSRSKQNAAKVSKTSQENPETLSKKECTADKTPKKSGRKITEAKHASDTKLGTSYQKADVKKTENNDITKAEYTTKKKCTPPDVNTCIRCKCGSTFTRVSSLNRHWRRNCKIASESDKDQIIEKIRKALAEKRVRRKESKVVSKKIKTKAQNLVVKARNLAVKNANKKLIAAKTAKKKMQIKKAQQIKRRGRRNFMGGFANPSDPPGCYPCPCGRKYKYRRDLQTHQRKSETCPKTAWISEKKIQEYGQAPECLKKSVALIRKWQARRPSVSPSKSAKRKRSLVTVKEEESDMSDFIDTCISPQGKKADSAKMKRKSANKKVLDSKTTEKNVEATKKRDKLENIMKELTHGKKTSGKQRNPKSGENSEDIQEVYPCSCGKLYTHKEDILRHLRRSLCDTTAYMRKMLGVGGGKEFERVGGVKTKVKEEAKRRKSKSDLFMEAANMIGQDLVAEFVKNDLIQKEHQLIQKENQVTQKEKGVAMIYRTKQGIRKPVKRLVRLQNKRFQCVCGKQFKHRYSLTTHHRRSKECATATRIKKFTVPIEDSSNVEQSVAKGKGENIIEIPEKNSHQEIKSSSDLSKEIETDSQKVKDTDTIKTEEPNEKDVQTELTSSKVHSGKFGSTRSATNTVSKNLVKKSKNYATNRRIKERMQGPYICPCGKEYTLIRALQRHQTKSKSCPKTAWKILPVSKHKSLRSPKCKSLRSPKHKSFRSRKPLDTNNNGSEDERLAFTEIVRKPARPLVSEGTFLSTYKAKISRKKMEKI